MWDSVAEAKRWWRQAENDLEFARLGLREEFYSQVCFLAQQSAEKAVKAIGYSLGERTVFGHSILVLADHYSDQVPGLGDLLQEAGILDQYYIPARYPNGLPGGVPFMAFGREQATTALEAAEIFLRTASRHIGDITS